MKNTSLPFSFLPIFFAFLIGIISAFSCSNQIDDLCTNPDSLIASEINKRRIVLIGESPHSDFILYNGVVKILSEWVKICEKDNSQKFTLNVVLEIDSATAGYIDHFIKTGCDSMLYNNLAPFLNMEDLEFYIKLRKIGMDIDRLNENGSNRIAINILGFEETFLNNEVYFRKDQQEQERWFVNERDKNISVKLTEYIKTHSNNEHYLLNYGAAHLQSGYVNKNLGFSLPDEETYGYYLFHYLNSEFGQDSVMAYVQAIYMENIFGNTFLSDFSQVDVLIPSDKFPINDINPEPNLFRVSRYFVSPFVRYHPHPFSMVFSRFEVEKLSERIEIFGKYLPGYKSNLLYNRYLQNIFFITGEKFSKSSGLKAWLKANPDFNGIERIDSKEYASFIFEVLKESKENNRERLLNDLGFSSEDLTPYSKDPAYWFENWKTINRKAKFINAIGIYWIGNPKEKENAKKYLIEFTGEDHSEAQLYLKWFRKKYFNYEG
jgi:hypothetical protein